MKCQGSNAASATFSNELPARNRPLIDLQWLSGRLRYWASTSRWPDNFSSLRWPLISA